MGEKEEMEHLLRSDNELREIAGRSRCDGGGIEEFSGKELSDRVDCVGVGDGGCSCIIRAPLHWLRRDDRAGRTGGARYSLHSMLMQWTRTRLAHCCRRGGCHTSLLTPSGSWLLAGAMC